MTNAAYLELLASYEAAIEAASFALKTATALAEANQRGERLSETDFQQTLESNRPRPSATICPSRLTVRQ